MKLRSTLIACGVLAGLVVGLSTTPATAAPERVHAASAPSGTGLPNDPNLQYYGRWNSSDPSYPAMGFAGGYLQAGFTGSSIGVRQRRAIDLYYSIDRSPPKWRRNVSGDLTLATGLSGTSHTIRVGYRERESSYTGDAVFGGLILAGGAQTVPSARPRNLVEFVGDSITVGYRNANRPFVAYPWLAGEALGAGHTQVARSGACLVGRQGCLAMMDLFRRSSTSATHDDWDFSTYQATAVVINLGTNDIGHGVSANQFQQNYIVMLQRVRQAYPQAHIFAMRTFQGWYAPETRNAVASRNAAGDGRVHFVDTTGWLNPATDTSDQTHPNETGHAKIAQRLGPILNQYLCSKGTPCVSGLPLPLPWSPR